VLLYDGTTQPIDENEPGDTVWSRDPETGEFGCREVVALKITPEQRVLSVEVSTSEGGSEIFGVTAEHPFRVVGEGWKPAEELKPGDEIFTSAGGWMWVTGSTWQAYTQTVYNFEVADFHTYFVGDGGAWVHNDCFDVVRKAQNLPQKARLYTDQKVVFDSLLDNNGISANLASKRLHSIKEEFARGGADNVIFDHTGNVYSPETGAWLGSLTAGGAKRIK